MNLYLGDCLEILPTFPDNSVDLVLADPPYGITACKWDSVIPLEPLWKELRRITKQNAAIVMMASQPFTTALISSNPRMFRYDLIWCKNKGTGFFNANKMQLRAHEDIIVFYAKLPTYNPQKTKGDSYRRNGSRTEFYLAKNLYETISNGGRYPLSWVKFTQDKNKLHPTQKPVALMEYLIKTYTNPGDTVLDFCMGSGTTGVAAQQCGRDFIGVEKDPDYFEIAKTRIGQSQAAA